MDLPLPVEAHAGISVAPEDLHPALWRAHQLGGSREAAVPSGFAALDAELPGGGWPRRVLTELLLPHPGVGEMRLLAPALGQLGVDAQRLIVVHGRDGAHGARHLLASADLLWALEQALKSGHVGAVLAWPPRTLRAEALRRLQLAAQAHDGPAFVLRDIELRDRPSPAPLRLSLHGAATSCCPLLDRTR